MLTYGASPDANDPGIARVMAAAARNALPLNLLCWGRLDQVDQLAAKNPDTQIIIDHLGLQQPFAPPAPKAPFAELPKVLKLAAYPNVAIKISGACTLSHQPFPYDDIWDPLRRILDAYGFDRCMWGTDWTRAVALLTYKQGVDAFRLTDRLTDPERAQLMGGTLQKIYRWSPTKVCVGSARRKSRHSIGMGPARESPLPAALGHPRRGAIHCASEGCGERVGVRGSRKGHRASASLAFDEGQQSIQQTLHVLIDVNIVHTEDAVAEPTHCSGTRIVAGEFRFRAVRAAVDLDDDLALAAKEVSKIGPYRCLPHELVATQPATAQLGPQLRLCRDRLRSQGTRSVGAPGLLTAHGKGSPWLRSGVCGCPSP